MSCKRGAEDMQSSISVVKFTWCSGAEFKARISKKLNVVSTCNHTYSQKVTISAGVMEDKASDSRDKQEVP